MKYFLLLSFLLTGCPSPVIQQKFPLPPDDLMIRPEPLRTLPLNIPKSTAK